MTTRIGEWMLPGPVALAVLLTWLPFSIPLMAGLTFGLGSYAVLTALVGEPDAA